MKILLDEIPGNPYGYSDKDYFQRSCYHEGQQSILSQIVEVDTTWKNKPDSEGWWWYKFGINLMCLKLHKNPFGYLYYFDSGETWGIEDHAGKWQKAILPQELGE